MNIFERYAEWLNETPADIVRAYPRTTAGKDKNKHQDRLTKLIRHHSGDGVSHPSLVAGLKELQKDGDPSDDVVRDVKHHYDTIFKRG